LITEVEDAAFGAVEAHLLLVFNKRSIQGAIGQIVAGRPLEDIDLIVTGRGGTVVPIFSL
jgi:hypothetical protein